MNLLADYLWLFGGQAIDGGVSDSVFSSDAVDRTSVWRKWQPSGGGATPVARHSHSAASLPRGDGMIILGGVQSDGGVLADAWVGYTYQAGNSTLFSWSSIASPPHEGGVSSAAMAVYGDVIYVIGGRNGTGYRHPDLYTLRVSGVGPFTGVWSNIGTGNPDLGPNETYTSPPARDGAGFARSGNGLYLFGGRGESGEVMDDLWLYRPGSGWYNLSNGTAAHAPARYGHAMIGVTHQTRYLRDKIYIFGGRGAGGEILGDTWEIDVTPPPLEYDVNGTLIPPDDTPVWVWTDFTLIPLTASPRWGMGVELRIVEGKTPTQEMWMAGGFGNDTNASTISPVLDLYEFDLNFTDSVCREGFYNQVSAPSPHPSTRLGALRMHFNASRM